MTGRSGRCGGGASGPRATRYTLVKSLGLAASSGGVEGAGGDERSEWLADGPGNDRHGCSRATAWDRSRRRRKAHPIDARAPAAVRWPRRRGARRNRLPQVRTVSRGARAKCWSSPIPAATDSAMDLEGRLKIRRESSDGAAGVAFDDSGGMLVAERGSGHVTRIDETGAATDDCGHGGWQADRHADRYRDCAR